MEVDPSNGATEADLVIPVPDVLVADWAGLANTFLPDPDTVRRCQDKAKAARILGDLAPRTYWVRETTGAGGRGARTEMAAQYLPGRNMSCELVFWHGELLGHFCKERLSYLVAHREANVTGHGTSLVSTCIPPGNLVHDAHLACKRLSTDGVPHGIFGVDFREDEWGIARITEVNAGRFLTASYVYFYRAGYNLPRLAVERALGLPETPLGPYPEGISIVRQIDHEPWVGRLTTKKVW
jgi:hypothetical protein